MNENTLIMLNFLALKENKQVYTKRESEFYNKKNLFTDKIMMNRMTLMFWRFSNQNLQILKVLTRSCTIVLKEYISLMILSCRVVNGTT